MSPPRRSAADELAGRISEAVMNGDIAVGTWLRQEALAERFAVSRQPVREALRSLQAYGIVEIHPHRGALVRRPSGREIREAYLVRAELEGLAASLAAERATDEELGRLRAADARFEELVDDAEGDPSVATPDLGRWTAANNAFHEAILDAAGARMLASTVEGLHRAVPRSLTGPALRTRRLLRRNVVQHQRVRAAIEAGDPDAAREAMREHILTAGELIVERLERDEA